MRRQAAQVRDERRGTRTERGYNNAWLRFRSAYIDEVVAEHPFCADCNQLFSSRSDIELHHIRKVRDHRDEMLDPSNIRALCHACHSRRTARGE